ncbi:hypothetical protein [Kribbella swartbergensis]
MSAGHVGRPVPRDSNEYRFVAGVISAVEQLSGRPSRWNGELNEELRPGTVGSALDDGGMTVNVDEVLKPIAHAYTAGRPLTEVELLQVRDAVLTLVHEARHLSHRFGDEHSPGGVPAYSADALVLEEGLTETWAHQHVDAVIQHLGMDKVQPELLDAETFDSYPAYTAATDEVVRGTAEVCGLSPSAVRETLERADRTQRLAALADLVIDQRLADVMPAEERDTVKVQLVQQLRQPLGDVVPVQKSELVSDVGKTIAGHQCAQRAVTALSTTTAELEDGYRDMRQLQKFLGGQPPAGRALGTQCPTPAEPGKRVLREPAGRGHAVE